MAASRKSKKDCKFIVLSWTWIKFNQKNDNQLRKGISWDPDHCFKNGLACQGESTEKNKAYRDSTGGRCCEQNSKRYCKWIRNENRMVGTNGQVSIKHQEA